jgi:DNA-binding IclR family transcriptional regulator
VRELSGWTVHLAIAQGADTLFLERLPALRGMSAMGEYGRGWPRHETSSGKVICANDPAAAAARVATRRPARS